MKRTTLLLTLLPIAVVLVAACGGDEVDLGGGGQQSGGAADAGATSTGTNAGGDGATSTPKVPNPGGGVFDFEATASTAAADGAKAVVVWTVSSGSPDYTYAFGGGTTAGTQVFVSFSASPPADALNAGKIGVGLVGVVDASSTLAEGKLTKADLDTIQLVSANHAVIYRATSEVLMKNGWDGAFPKDSYACGRCVRKDEGFDAFEPVDCSEVTVEPMATADMCNWT